MSIKAKRKNKGYSQIEIANKLGIPVRTYKRYETQYELKGTAKYARIFDLIKSFKESSKNELRNLKVTVVGIGYVGLSIGILLSETNKVTLVDISEEKVNLINSKKAPFKDTEI